MEKVGIILIILYFEVFFKCSQILGKYLKLDFLIKDLKYIAFSQNWVILNAKKHKCDFFF